MNQGTYILHFSKPIKYHQDFNYGDNQHYIGFSIEMDDRIKKHLKGKGSAMTRAAVSQGADLSVAFTFPAVNCEKQLMKSGFRAFCKFCSPEIYELSCKETKMYEDMKKNIFHGVTR